MSEQSKSIETHDYRISGDYFSDPVDISDGVDMSDDTFSEANMFGSIASSIAVNSIAVNTDDSDETDDTASKKSKKKKDASDDEGLIPPNEELNEKYVFMSETLDALEIALYTGRNVILFGKGGHGKSEVSLDFLRSKGIEPYIMTMGSGTTVDRLFGGMDLKLFEETGKIEYLVENSFMNNEFVIFEELFDAPDFILEQLKDILSSRIFRNGTQVYPIKTKLIICCTNKTRDQFSKNDSLKALMERFPLEHEVKWSDYNVTTYTKLLETVRKYADPMLTYILQEYAKKGTIISPRIAIAAADILERFGPESLKYLADFRGNNQILADSIKKFKAIFEVRDIKKEMDVLSNKFDSEILPNLKSSDTNVLNSALAEMDELIDKAKALNKRLKSTKVDDSLTPEINNIIKASDKMTTNWSKEIDLVKKLASIPEDSI